MFAICGIAFSKGNPKYLTNGIDKSGFLCGIENTLNGTKADLRGMNYLYYLDPFELLNPTNLPYAKTVCVKSCPSLQQECMLSALPCTNSSQYMCPYYGASKMNASLSYAQPFGTDYFGALNTTTNSNCTSGIDPTFDKYKDNFVSNTTGAQFCGQLAQLTSQFPSKGPCYAVWAQTVPWFNRCVPLLPADVRSKLISSAAASSGSKAYSGISSGFNTNSARLKRYIADIGKAKWLIIIAGLVGGLVLSCVWMLILRMFAGLLVWLTVFASNLLFIACCIFCYSKAGLMASHGGEVGKAIAASLSQVGESDPSESDRKVWAIVAYMMTALTVLLFLFTLVMIKRLKIAIACLKVAAQAISTMPSILFFPILPFLFEVGLVFYWIYVTGYLYSSGTITQTMRSTSSSSSSQYDVLSIMQLLGLTTASTSAPPPPPPPPPAAAKVLTDAQCADDPDCKFDLTWDKSLQYMFIYHFFGLLWTNQFIVGFGYVCIAGAIAQFYWTRGESSRMPRLPVVAAMKNTTLYHLGSIALGSFIIAIIQFIRAMLEYLDHHLKETGGENKLIKYLMCCAKCCMWYVEKIMKFINKNAYILVAVKGTGYCTSAGRAITLIVGNALRVAAVSIVGDALIWLGKISVAAGCGLIAFLISDMKVYTDPVNHSSTYLSSPLLPVLLAVIIGYVIASLFFSVYEYAISTILLCFCEDCESHNGSAQYAPPLLMAALGESQKHMDRKKGKVEVAPRATNVSASAYMYT
ncbi:hypothetical protein WJX72_010746 [[Myrmecia] bisecta]|uniref:Choline transporter-like protein n=1 Tax=[Myrmecia] bisecta TaxID=41462 RepID=A0AAW1P942_9CHLO